MRITNVFDAVREGTYNDFKNFYSGDINIIHEYTGMNLLCLALVNDKNPEDKVNIIKFLISEGIDINATDKYNSIPLKYAITITKKTTQEIKSVYRYLLEQGSNYTQKDSFGKSCIDYASEYSWRNDFIKLVEEFKDAN